ncbi:MAG: ABC transporter permease [Gammaproteobacteria bacterium]|nr:ABC transporter permease [Gammaproteobacteria bacterium]
MRGISTVFRKEVRESLRDRRAVFNTLLLGPILFPVLFLGLAYFGVSLQEERAEKTLEVPVIGQEHAPNLVEFLQQQGMVVLPPPDDPEALVREQKAEVIIRIPDDFADHWREGTPAPVEVIADPSRRESGTALNRVRWILNGYNQLIGRLRLQLRGISSNLDSPIQIKDVDLSTPKSRALMVMIFLPYILMLTAFTGGLHQAMDSTAGEKERQSLEPLLINPVARWQIMSGKMLATNFFAFASLTLTLLSFKLFLPFMPIDQLGLDLHLSSQAVLKILLVIAPVTVLAAALLTLLAAYAKTYKEAQSYMGLVILIPIIPSMLFMVNPVKPETHMMWPPLFSQNLLIGEIVRGETIPALWLGLSFGGTLTLGLILAAIAATLYNRPKLIFTSS